MQLALPDDSEGSLHARPLRSACSLIPKQMRARLDPPFTGGRDFVDKF
jgi:hypothetical protein